MAATLSAQNAARWAAMKIDPARLAEFDRVAARLVASKSRFQAIEAKTGVPWAVVAVILEREAGGRFDRYLGNGQRLDQVTTEVPAGRGPFATWDDGCVDALVDCAPYAAHWPDWSIGGALVLVIKYNGLGYDNGPVDKKTGIKYPPMASPYAFSGTDQYTRGKYIADHVFDPLATDKQLGCAPLLARMMALDSSIKFVGAGVPTPNQTTAVIVGGAIAAGTAAHAAAGATTSQIALGVVFALVVAGIIFAIIRSKR